RPNQFLPQLGQVRRTDADMLSEGCRTFLWGLFMKLCISDRLVVYTTAVLDNAQAHNSTSIIVAILKYALQIYTDFAGYSNMAIGVGLLLGLKVTPNFNRPFLATSVAAFWRRWHISLTTWITDYIFMPLNLRWRDRGAMGLYMATMVNLLVIGAWHGANWTYVVFGAFYGVVMVVEMSLSQRRKKFEKSHHLKTNALYRTLRWMEVFLIYAFAAMIFRAADMGDVCTVVSQIFTCPGSLYIGDWLVFVYGGCSVVLLLFKEVKDELGWNVHLLHAPDRWVRIVSFALLLCYVIGTGVLDGVNFIYMQF
ncbi:MAG: MBOAT family protein, partial [Paludibacteraceae bacterium]|nr:MBOAT family protein [Paludibacteraceae bacterium]